MPISRPMAGSTEIRPVLPMAVAIETQKMIANARLESPPFGAAWTMPRLKADNGRAQTPSGAGHAVLSNNGDARAPSGELMFQIIGLVLLFGLVFGSFIISGGHMGVKIVRTSLGERACRSG